MHRDIKGSNILVNDEGRVKLADFGASKKLANLKANLMTSLTVRGTPYFMAPEVFEEKYSAKADIWGIGCVAYQMVTTRPPWKEGGFTNPISLFNYIKKQEGPPQLQLDEAQEAHFNKEDPRSRNLLDSLLRRCFHQDASQRPTAIELQSDPFFLEVHHGDEEEMSHSRGLFSPGNDTMASWEETESPNGHGFHALSMESPSPMKMSRSRSVVQWPTWAKKELNKEKALLAGSPGLMGSLALSEDSTRANPFARASPGEQSTLVGLHLLDKSSSSTYDV